MKTLTAIKYFGSQQALADAITQACPRTPLTQPPVSLWGEYPPPHRQMQLELLTMGELRAEPGIIPISLVET